MSSESKEIVIHAKNPKDPEFAQRVERIKHMGQINTLGLHDDFINSIGRIGNAINTWKRKKDHDDLLKLINYLKGLPDYSFEYFKDKNQAYNDQNKKQVRYADDEDQVRAMLFEHEDVKPYILAVNKFCADLRKSGSQLEQIATGSADNIEKYLEGNVRPKLREIAKFFQSGEVGQLEIIVTETEGDVTRQLTLIFGESKT